MLCRSCRTIMLYLCVFPGHEVPAQECSGSSDQKTHGVVSNTCEWKMDNSDDDQECEVNGVSGCACLNKSTVVYCLLPLPFLQTQTEPPGTCTYLFVSDTYTCLECFHLWHTYNSALHLSHMFSVRIHSVESVHSIECTFCGMCR